MPYYEMNVLELTNLLDLNDSRISSATVVPLVCLFAILHGRLAGRSQFLRVSYASNMYRNLTCHADVRLGFALEAEARVINKPKVLSPKFANKKTKSRHAVLRGTI